MDIRELLKRIRCGLHDRMTELQVPGRSSRLSPAFVYDLAKIAVKEIVWRLPSPCDRLACRFLVWAGFYNQSALVYLKAQPSNRTSRTLSGPFKGMRYYPVSTGGEFLPKVTGTYERELHEAIEDLCQTPFDQVVDIGAAEGYYAVGLALRLRNAQVYCFDGNPGSHWLLRRNARLNDVSDRVFPGHWCSHETLSRVLRKASQSLLICDCEGGEEELLCPRRVPELLRTTMIVEIHDFPAPGRRSTLLHERFSKTHCIATAVAVARSREDLPLNLDLSEQEVQDATYEGRPLGMQWFVMVPRMNSERRLVS